MSHASTRRTFARVPADTFVGRAKELSRVTSLAGTGDSLVVLATPGAGTSELLRQAYDHLFWEQNEIAPVYFELKPSDQNALAAARRFLYEFLLQTVAFRRGDASIIEIAPTIDELAGLADADAAKWVEPLSAVLERSTDRADAAYLRTCFGAALRAHVAGVPTIVMVDGLDNIDVIDDGERMMEVLFDAARRGSFVLAGPRRSLFARARFDTLAIERLTFDAGAPMVASLAASLGVEINAETRDLIAVQLGGSAVYTDLLLRSVAEAGQALNSFESFEKAYCDELFGGRIRRYLDERLDAVVPPGSERDLLTMLVRTLESGQTSETYWQRHLKTDIETSRRLVQALNHREFISARSGWIAIDENDVVLADHIRLRSRLELDGQLRAIVLADTIIETITRAPQLMASLYRNRAAIGLQQLLSVLDGQRVPRVLLDHDKYRERLKGAADDAIDAAIAQETELVNLPDIVFSTHASAFYSPIGELTTRERAAVGVGFDSERQPVTWLAAEVESKLEATRDVAEFWLDRLEMVAVESGLSNVTIWLVAPEGFNDEALAAIRERGGIGSNRRQVELLRQHLASNNAAPASITGVEHDVIVPMGGDSEIAAVRALDEIAKEHNIGQKTVNQVRTALIEACINAAEHSLSPDGKIYLKFGVADNKLTISVANRGLRLADRKITEADAENGRRGWGLKLMRGLMDDVTVDDTDDGTRITMTKAI